MISGSRLDSWFKKSYSICGFVPNEEINKREKLQNLFGYGFNHLLCSPTKTYRKILLVQFDLRYTCFLQVGGEYTPLLKEQKLRNDNLSTMNYQDQMEKKTHVKTN